MGITAGYSRRLLNFCVSALALAFANGAWPQAYAGKLPFWRMEAILGWGLFEPTQRLVTTRSDFVGLWNQIHVHSQPVPNLPYIDFSKEMILIIGMGQRSSGGYSVRTEWIEDTGENIRVLFRIRSPGLKCMVTASFTSPVELIRMERIDKPVKFIASNEVTDCI